MRFATKISFSILLVGLATLALSLYAVYQLNYDSVIDSELHHTSKIAGDVSTKIHDFLEEKVKTALTLANAPIIKNALKQSNALYEALPGDERKEKISRLNAKWKSIDSEKNPFIETYTDNAVARFLKLQQKILEGEYGEIFLTNRYGVLVAATSKLTTLAHGHKYWWLGAYEDGAGKIFLDDRGFDDSVKGYVLGLVVPVKADGKIIGILKCNLNILGAVTQCLSGSPDNHNGLIKLARSGGMVVFEPGHEPLSTHVKGPVHTKMMKHSKGAFIIKDGGASYMVGLSRVKMTQGGGGYGFGGTFQSIDHKKGNTGESWIVVCYRPMAKVLAPIRESVKGTFLVGAVILLVLIIVSRLLSRVMARPIHMLEKAFKRIGKGDFEYQVNYSGNDEFKGLAESLNRMVGKLAQTTTSVEHLEIEVRRKEAAQSELKQREALLKTVIDTDPNCIFLKDRNGRFLLVNRTMAELHNTTPEDMVGKTDENFLEGCITSAEEVNAFVKDDREVIAKKQVKVIPEERFTCSNGMVKWFETTKVPHFPGRYGGLFARCGR